MACDRDTGSIGIDEEPCERDYNHDIYDPVDYVAKLIIFLTAIKFHAILHPICYKPYDSRIAYNDNLHALRTGHRLQKKAGAPESINRYACRIILDDFLQERQNLHHGYRSLIAGIFCQNLL